MCSDECRGCCADCGTQADFDEVEHDRTGGPTPGDRYTTDIPEVLCYTPGKIPGTVTLAFNEVINLFKRTAYLEQLLATADEALGAVAEELQGQQSLVEFWRNDHERLSRDRMYWVNQAEGYAREIATLTDTTHTWRLKAEQETRIADARIAIINDVVAERDALQARLTRQANTLMYLLAQGVDIVDAAYNANGEEE